MADSIFKRLEFNFDGAGVLEMSSNVASFMNTIPTLLQPWQIKDISDNNVGGYHTNPVSGVTQTIRNTCNSLVTLLSSSSSSEDGFTNTISSVVGTTSQITNLFTTINTNCSSIGGTNGGLFIEHTNRISGVTPIGADADVHPYYSTAMSVGQTIMYLTNQSDGISNNAPIVGSFTSILIGDDLDALELEISSYEETINSSITLTETFDGNGNSSITRTSSLSYDVVNNMCNNIITINTTLSTRRLHDENFFQNSRDVSDEFNTLRSYSSMGQTANNLCQNYVGSAKLLSRINS